MQGKITKQLALILGPLLFICIQYFIHLPNLSATGQSALAATVWIAIWWVLEAVPLAVTSLLPLILFPLFGIASIQETSQSYGHKYIFLFLGGFMISIAMQKWNLHKRIAMRIIGLFGNKTNQTILGFMIASAFLSMWISNTATVIMLLPVGLSVCQQMGSNPRFGQNLMLSIAYAASIGGISTIIGTPPNLVLAAIVEDNLNMDLSFSKWFLIAFPICLILLMIVWFYLTYKSPNLPIAKNLNSIPKITTEEKRVLTVFVLTAIAWILRSSIINKILPKVDDTIIAMIAMFALFIIPSDERSGRLLEWKDTKNLSWDILLLFGGGMALAKGIENSGLASYIGELLLLLNNIPLLILILILVAGINFLTEISSNLATAAMILPIILAFTIELDLPVFPILAAATISASCAFMLPVATPPNTIVFSSGLIPIKTMFVKGLALNIIAIVLITSVFYFIL